MRPEKRDLPLPRKLPIRTPPVAGESFASYMDRLARDMRVSLDAVIAAIGMVRSKHRNHMGIPGGYGVFLTSERMIRFCHATDLPESVVMDMLLARYEGLCVDLSGIDLTDACNVNRPSNRPWAYLSGTHACPACLAEHPEVETQSEPVAGVWKLSWKLPWAFSCTEHGTLLLDRCPGCKTRLRTGWYANRGKPAYHARIPEPTLCANPIPPDRRVQNQNGPCGYPLTEASAPSLTAWPDVLEAQKHLQRLLDGSAGTPTVAGEAVPTLQYFGTLRTLSSLLLAYGSTEALGQAPAFALESFERRQAAYLEGRRRKLMYAFSIPPEDAALLCAVVPAAVKMADAASVEALSAMIEPLVRCARADGLSTPALLRPLTVSSVRLAEAFERTYVRRGSPAGMLLRQNENPVWASVRYGGLSPDYVPQLLWESTYSELFAELFPRKSRYYARRVCSMSIVRLMGPPSWPKAAELLELPVSRSKEIAKELVGVLSRSDQGKTEVFAERIDEVARRMTGTPERDRVNYRLRRRALEHLEVVPYTEWERICEQVGIGPGKDGVRNRCAAAWIWCRIAGGDRWLSPAIRCNDDNTIRVHYQRFEQECTGELARSLTDYGISLLTDSATTSENRSHGQDHE